MELVRSTMVVLHQQQNNHGHINPNSMACRSAFYGHHCHRDDKKTLGGDAHFLHPRPSGGWVFFGMCPFPPPDDGARLSFLRFAFYHRFLFRCSHCLRQPPTESPAGPERLVTDALVPGGWCPHRRIRAEAPLAFELIDRLRTGRQGGAEVPRVVARGRARVPRVRAGFFEYKIRRSKQLACLHTSSMEDREKQQRNNNKIVRQGCDDWADNPISWLARGTTQFLVARDPIVNRVCQGFPLS